MDADETQDGAEGGESQPQAEVENTPEAQTNGSEETGEGGGGGGAEQTEIKSEDSPPEVDTIATEDGVAVESEATPPENQAQAETDGTNVEPPSADPATESANESTAPRGQEGQAADPGTTETTDPEHLAAEGAATESPLASAAAADDAANPEASTTEQPEEAAESGGEPRASEIGESAANVEEEQNAGAVDGDPQEQDGGEKEAEGATDLEGDEPIIADEGAEDQTDQQQGDGGEHDGEDVQPQPEIEEAEDVPDAGDDEAAPGKDEPAEEESSQPLDEDQSRDDGQAVRAKPPTRFSVTADQPPSQKKPNVPPPVPDKKHKKTYPHLARPSKEKNILNAIRKPAAPHDYFGLIFSAESKRPPTYYHNYFLPVQKQPLKQQHMKVVGKVIPPDAINTFIKAPLHSMPLSSVKVRWMLNRRNTIYKASDLYAYLSKYGKIEHVYQLSNNSALVVFDELLAALAVVKDPRLGYPWDPLFAEWLEPRLNNRGYFKKHANVSDSPLLDHGYIHNNIHNKSHQPKCS